MERNKDPALSGILARMGEGVGHLCPKCRSEVVRGYLAWHPHNGGLSRAQILQAEIDRILLEEPSDDPRRQTLEKLFSIKDPDLLQYFYLYQSRATGHLFHYAYLKHRYALLHP